MVLCKRVAPISFYFGGFDWASMLGIILCWALWYFAVFWWLCRAMRSDGFLGGRSELSYWFVKRSWYCDKWVLALEQCKLLILLRKKAFLLLFQAKNNSGGWERGGREFSVIYTQRVKSGFPFSEFRFYLYYYYYLSFYYYYYYIKIRAMQSSAR